MKVICVTGTPGTGKSTIAMKLAKKLGFLYIDANKVISRLKLSDGFDKKRDAKIIDVSKLNRAIIKEIIIGRKNKLAGMIIDSHLSHYLPRKYVDYCIVAKCGIKILNRRLSKRGYSKKKVRENLQSEIFEICLLETMQRKHKIIIADTSKGFNIDRLAHKVGA